MRLSIIVPVYNMVAEGKLDFCIQSLLNQTVEDYEIIAVDDKSTDTSLAALRVWEEKFPEKIKVIASPENRRQGEQRTLVWQQRPAHGSALWTATIGRHRICMKSC